MKRLWQIALPCAIVASTLAAARAAPIYRPLGSYYYPGGYAPRSSYYSGLSYDPYGSGHPIEGYAYPSVGDYSRGYVDRSPNESTYNGLFPRDNRNLGYYGGAYRPVYNPYGYGSYSPYGSGE